MVYRARDAKLNRDVAIKVLLPSVANDPDRLARFSREAQVLADKIAQAASRKPQAPSRKRLRPDACFGCILLTLMPATRQEIGPYKVVRSLGQGGMGTVLLAEDTRLSRLVALKTFSGPQAHSDYARAQLLAEARAAAALSHPNIASVHDVLDVDGEVVIVFEYVEGDTLASRLARGPLSLSTALAIAGQLADALVAAHGQGIIHRDLKPGNIIITPENVAKVLDFGIARVIATDPSALASAQTTPAMFVGTVGYAAPEQCLGQPVDARADVFSLGVVLFEMLTGRRPFPGDDATAVMRAMLHSDPPSVADAVANAPLALDSLITRALSRNPVQRPQTAREWREGLRSILTDRRSPAPARAGGRGWLIAALLAAVLGTGLFLSWLIWNRQASTMPGGTATPVVAVMPLTNASGDASMDYLAIGIAENLITSLAGLPSMTVLSRTAVAEVRHRQPDLAKVANELDATYLVDGSVQQYGTQLLITLSLIRPDASVAWAGTATGTLDEIFKMQAQLASALGQVLQIRLSPADRAALAERPTNNAEASAAYWRGRLLLDRRDVQGNIQNALLFFDEAVRIDSRFADAHAARGEALWARYLESRDASDARAAVAAGTDALRINSNSASVRFSLGLTLAGTGRLAEAAEELAHALVLRPNYDDARQELGNVLARQGHIDQAVAEFRRAIALRPQFWRHYNALGRVLLQSARYPDALAAFRRVTELQPDSFIGYAQMGTTYQFLGDYDAALTHYQRAIERGGSPRVFSNVGAIHHLRGEYQQAVDAYREVLKASPNVHVTHRNLGDALNRLGNQVEARAAYERAAALAREGLTVNPKDVDSLSPLSVYLAKLGRREEALAVAREALTLAPDDTRVMFREAVVYTLCGMYQPAIDSLRRALTHGLSREIITQDEDLEPLRKLPGFAALVQTAR